VTNASSNSSVRTIIALILLALAGMAGNYFEVTLVYGVDFIFGSIAVLTAVRLFGPALGTLVAAAVGGYLYLLWEHPYAPLIFTAEALVVGLLSERYKWASLLLVDGFFWAVVGIPLITLFYGVFLDTSTVGVIMVVLKQSVNGLFNALVAALLLKHTPLHRWVGSSQKPSGFPLQHVLLNLMVAFLMVPSLTMIVRAGQLAFAKTTQSIETRLQIETDEATAQLHNWNMEYAYSLEQLSRLVQSDLLNPTGTLNESLRMVLSSSRSFLRLEVVAPDGSLVGAEGQPASGSRPDLTNLESVKQTLRPVTSGLHLTQVFPDTPVITVTYPVLVEGRLAGIVQGYLSPEPAQRLLMGLLHKDLVHFSLLDQSDRVYVTLRPDLSRGKPFDRSPEGGVFYSGPGRYQRYPVGQGPSMNRWKASYEVLETQLESMPGWKLIVEVPLAPYQAQLFQVISGDLLIVYLLFMAAIPISWVISHHLTRPLTDLARLTRSLPTTLRSGAAITWPNSRIQEILSLTTDVQWMAGALRTQLDEIAADARQQRVLLSAAMESVTTPILITDSKARIVYVNPAFVETYGYTADEAIGRSPAFLQGPQSDQKAIRRLQDALRNKQGLGVDLLNYRKDGTPVDTGMIVAPIFDSAGQLTHFVGIQRDISAQKTVERVKGEFISSVSQEVRTPLAAIQGALGVLSGSLMQPTDSRTAQLLSIALENTERLTRLMNNLVDLERIESGRVELRSEVCRADLLVELALSNFRPVAEQARLLLQVEAPPLLLITDPEKVTQVLSNLVSNAIKFSEPGATVHVSARSDGHEVSFSVRDQGCGIAPAQVSQAFAPFRQAGDSRRRSGTGLGLAIAHGIVVQLGGRIWVESELEKGSTFSFTLPAPALAPAKADRRVLFCGGDRGISGSLSGLLEQAGYTMHRSAGADVTITALGEVGYKALLLGWSVSDGVVNFLRQLKQEKRFRDIPILMLGMTQPQEPFHVPIGPVLDWVEGPCPGDPERILRAVRRACEGKPSPALLLVDDNPARRERLANLIEPCGVKVLTAEDGANAVTCGQSSPPDMVVVHLLTRDADGRFACEYLRRDPHLSSVPLLLCAWDLTEATLEQLQQAIMNSSFPPRTPITEAEFVRSVLDRLESLPPGRS